MTNTRQGGPLSVGPPPVPSRMSSLEDDIDPDTDTGKQKSFGSLELPPHSWKNIHRKKDN